MVAFSPYFVSFAFLTPCPSYISDDLVLRAKTFIALKPPHPADHDSFRNEVINQMPLTIDENAYLERNHDFMSLADEQEIGWLDVAVGRMLGLLPSVCDISPFT